LTHSLRLDFLSLFAGSKEEAVALHPSSVLGGGADISGNFLVFHERIKTSQVRKNNLPFTSLVCLLFIDEFHERIKTSQVLPQFTLDRFCVLMFGVLYLFFSLFRLKA
jgi:hypothetical protein